MQILEAGDGRSTPQAALATSTVPFKGWQVVFAGFTAQLFANFSGLSSVGFFVTSFEAEFATDAATLSLGVTFSILVMALLGPFIGSWLDRGSQKWIMVGGGALMTVGLLLASLATELWHLAVGYCVVANLGVALFGPMPSVALVSRWFVRRRGLAVGIAVAGATASSAIGPLVAGNLIPELGWRTALAVMAGVSGAILIPVFILFVSKSPEEIGQFPDGAAEPPQEVELDGTRSVAGEVFRSPNFYLISIAMALMFCSPIVMGFHLPVFAEKELNLSGAEFAPVFLVLACFSLAGKLVFGVVADRIDLRLAVFSNVALLVGSWLLLLTRPELPLLYVAGALAGAGIGAAGPLHAVLLGRCFGRSAFAEILGLGGLISLPFVGGAAYFAGRLAVASGNYTSAFEAVTIGLGIAAALCLFLRIPAIPAAQSA